MTGGVEMDQWERRLAGLVEELVHERAKLLKVRLDDAFQGFRKEFGEVCDAQSATLEQHSDSLSRQEVLISSTHDDLKELSLMVAQLGRRMERLEEVCQSPQRSPRSPALGFRAVSTKASRNCRGEAATERPHGPNGSGHLPLHEGNGGAAPSAQPSAIRADEVDVGNMVDGTLAFASSIEVVHEEVTREHERDDEEAERDAYRDVEDDAIAEIAERRELMMRDHRLATQDCKFASAVQHSSCATGSSLQQRDVRHVGFAAMPRAPQLMGPPPVPCAQAPALGVAASVAPAVPPPMLQAGSRQRAGPQHSGAQHRRFGCGDIEARVL